MHIPRVLAAAALTGLLSATVACGNQAASESALPKASTDDNPVRAQVGSKKLDPEDAMVEYAKCMREHGVDVPDPGPGGGPIVMKSEDYDQATLEAAGKACDPIMESAMADAPKSDIDGKFEEMLLAEAKCLREKGYDVPDPVATGGGSFEAKGEYPENAKGPVFEKAKKECDDKVGLGDMQSFSTDTTEAK